jgi:hypothetical protein
MCSLDILYKQVKTTLLATYSTRSHHSRTSPESVTLSTAQVHRGVVEFWQSCNPQMEN